VKIYRVIELNLDQKKVVNERIVLDADLISQPKSHPGWAQQFSNARNAAL